MSNKKETVVIDRSEWLKNLKAGDKVVVSSNTNRYDELLGDSIEKYKIGTVVGVDESIQVEVDGIILFFGPRGGREQLKGGKYGDLIIKPYDKGFQEKEKEWEKKRNEKRAEQEKAAEARRVREEKEEKTKILVDEILFNMIGVKANAYCGQRYDMMKYIDHDEIARLNEFCKTLKPKKKVDNND